jgi:hypothetical protein
MYPILKSDLRLLKADIFLIDQKLRKKLPSDPYEFEILLYAEKLAREEGIPGFEESSDGESEPETTYATKRQKKSDTPVSISNPTTESFIGGGDNNSINQKNLVVQNPVQKSTTNNFVQNEHQPQQQIQQTEEGSFKWVYGVNLFNTWFTNRIEQLKSKNPNNQLKLPNDLLKVG